MTYSLTIPRRGQVRLSNLEVLLRLTVVLALEISLWVTK
jgi:hypothetical protein